MRNAYVAAMVLMVWFMSTKIWRLIVRSVTS